MARTVQQRTKRLTITAPPSSRSRPVTSTARRTGRGRGGTISARGGKGRRAVTDARININRSQRAAASLRGRGRRGGMSSLSNRLGGRISDARQILNSRGGGDRQRTSSANTGSPRRPRPATTNAVAANAIMSSLSLNSTTERNIFGQAVRAAMMPVLAPLLGQSSVLSSSSRSTNTSSSNGPCSLRVANLAQTVTVSDLNDLFGHYPGFVGANFESGGIAVISFSQKNMAESALDEYNNRELDGRTMVIQLDNSPGVSQVASSRLGPKARIG